MALYEPAPGFKGRTFKLCVLIRWDFNFCVRSSPLRELIKVNVQINPIGHDIFIERKHFVHLVSLLRREIHFEAKKNTQMKKRRRRKRRRRKRRRRRRRVS